jgi:hypothetical protein
LVGYGTTSTRAKWRSLWSARVSTLKEALDTADTVRDGDISTARTNVRKSGLAL